MIILSNGKCLFTVFTVKSLQMLSALQVVGSDVRGELFAVQWQIEISQIPYSVYFSSEKNGDVV